MLNTTLDGQQRDCGGEGRILGSLQGPTLRPGASAEYEGQPYEVWSVAPDGAVILLRIGSETGPFFVRAEEREEVLVGGFGEGSPLEQRPADGQSADEGGRQ